MVLFTAAFMTQSTSLASIVETTASQEFAIVPSLAFAGVAFTMVSLSRERAGAGRQPRDPPRAHDDHEAMISSIRAVTSR